MKQIFAVFLFLILNSPSWAQMNYNIDAAVRTDPRAKNLTATVAYDSLLHGTVSKKNPFYGYTRLGVIVGGSPTVAGFFQVAPIAPLIFEVQKSRTLRFDNADRFDCKTYECQGSVDRTDYTIRGVVGFDQIFFAPSLMWREIRTDGHTRPVYLEQEVFVASSGFHRFTEASGILGYLISENQQAGLIYTADELSENQSRSHTASVFYRQKWGEFSVTGGLSQYKYEQLSIEGVGGFLTLDLDYGEKLSLF